jgi:3-oxoacyl-[acyl-carrier protein] reductase
MTILQNRTVELDGRVALITGAAQGIGRCLAEAFADAGARVALADLDADAAAHAADPLDGAVALAMDVAEPASVDAAVAETLARFGRLDVLVNNAAVFSTLRMKPFEEIAPQEWERVLAVNLTGTFLCCRAVAAPMRAQGRGRIVNLSSATVLSGRPNYLHYVTSKAGVVGMTRALARELGPDGVTVNALLPGSVDTGITRDSATPERAAGIVAAQAIGRRLIPDDLAGAALFLTSDQAAMVTGQSIVVDGGMNFV